MTRSTRKLLSLSCMLGVTLLGGGCGLGSDDKPSGDRPQNAQEAVLAAFDRYKVVGGFSASHGNKEVDDFLLDLIRNPDLPHTVDDIAVECGNSRYQDVLDRYIAGNDARLSQARKAWRNTSQPECGFSTFYEQLFPLVRRINRKLPQDEKLRVLACDPPLDWSRVTSMKKFERSTDREASIAAVIEREVLSKDRKALMLFGVNHMRHLPGTAVGQYEANGHDNVTYVIDDHHGFGNNDPSLRDDNDELEARMASWPVPSIVAIDGSWLERLDSAYFNQSPGERPTGERGPPGVDAYLYVGPRDSLLREPRSAQAMMDEDYIAELERRADRMGAPRDAPLNPKMTLKLESKASVFSYDP